MTEHLARFKGSPVRKQTIETLAKASWVLAILAAGLMAYPALRDQQTRMWMALIGLGVFGLGFAVGIFTLAKAFNSGMERAFRHALACTLANGAILSFVLIVILTAPPSAFPWSVSIISMLHLLSP